MYIDETSLYATAQCVVNPVKIILSCSLITTQNWVTVSGSG